MKVNLLLQMRDKIICTNAWDKRVTSCAAVTRRITNPIKIYKWSLPNEMRKNRAISLKNCFHFTKM